MDISKRIRQVVEENLPIRGMTYRAPGIPIRTYYCSILPFTFIEILRLIEIHGRRQEQPLTN